MTSAQHLVRALKAPLDPPVADGPLKITIAEHAWHDESFYLPNKAEVIAEFILSKFFKERMEGTSLGSERYWKLLSEVISSNSAPWLRPILGRISIVPIVTASLNSWSQLGSLHYAAYCISILYPLGTQKSTTEVLLDAWGVFLRNFVDDVSAVKIGLVVTQVYSDSLSNSASRKKASTNFIQNADLLNAWLERLTSSSNCPQYEYLRQSILSSGVETIFNLETLRPMFESPESAPLFLALSSTPRHTVIRALPLVFEHYVSSLKKHRGIIPSELNVIAMRFYDACTSLVRERDTEAWNTISALTGLVAKECLYGQGSSLGQNVAFALTGELTTATVRCLSATIRVDYDLVLPSMGKLLSRLLAIPQVHSDHFAFLDLLLEYHIKTRTVNTYIETLLSCLSPDSTVSLLPAQERYVIAHSSPVLHPQHLQKLGKAAQQFLTPSQCNGTVELVCETIKLLRERHKTAEKQWDAESGKGSRKKRKSDEMTVDRADSDQLALAFSLTSEVGRTVLSSLPMSSIPQRQAEQVRTTVALFREELVEHNLPKLLKRFMKSEDHEQENSEAKRKAPSGVLLWGTQVVIVSLLRLRYSVGLAGALSLPPIAESKLFRRLLLAISQDEDSLLPELALEIFRALFGQALVIDKSEASQLIDNALQFVEKRVSPSANIAWSGFPHELTFGEPGRFRAGLAALHLLLERWLPAINIVASQEQQRLLARLISRMSLSSGPLSKRGTELLVADHLLFRTLRSAQFWELRNIRSALLSTLVSSTSSLDSLPSEPSPSKKSPKLKQAQVDQFKVADVVSTYKLLLFFPIEYIAQSCRAELVKRAINADWRLSKRLEGGEEDEELLVGLSVVRTFLKRTFDFLGAVEQRTLCDVPNFILHLLEDASSTKGQSCHVQITLDLCEVYFLELLRHATRGGWAEAREVLNSYLQSPMFDDLESVRARSLVCLVELLRREFTFVGFSSQMRSVFQDVHARLTKDLEEKLDGVLEGPGSVSLVDTPDLLTSWHALLGLGQWIGLENCTFFGARLLKKLNVRFLSTQNNRAWTDRTSVITMAILLRELHFQGEVGRDALDIIVAGYLSCRKLVSSSGKVELDDFLAKACREFTPVNFEYVLGLLDEALVAAPSMAADLVHLALVLLGNHPHSTLRIMQGFFTRSVDIFTNDGTFITGPLDLRFQTLDFLVEHASERPAALRSLDLGRIWSLLSKYLSPSTVHDEATSAPIFHKIVTVLSAVMRLRRDLVTPMLPHLGMILRQLILCLRKCRPQLAPKQTEMVMSTQPQWITASQSLGIEEAKVLSRVLETLTTKTITRVHVTPTKTQKAESLATPFSKHAAFVLKAYIEAMNDALCVLTLDIRMELHPGLYALCGIIGEHSRDAMMVSALDASGKATLKALWREYEKQRYLSTSLVLSSTPYFVSTPSPPVALTTVTMLGSLRHSTTANHIVRAATKSRFLATVSPSFISNRKPPQPPPCPSKVTRPDSTIPWIDTQILRALDVQPQTSLSDIIGHYIDQTGNVLNVSLPYESRPTKERRVTFEDNVSSREVVTVAHCARDGDKHKIALSSGFALNAEAPRKGETLIATCGHTLEEIRASPLLRPEEIPPSDTSRHPLTATFVCVGLEGNMKVYPATEIVSSIPRSDVILISCDIPKGTLQSLPLSPYPAQPGASIRAHFVAPSRQLDGEWNPWIGDTWGKWARGNVLGYRDFAGREAKPGTYDGLSHIVFTPFPTAGSSGGPIVDEESGAVVGMMLGSRMDNHVHGVQGWGIPSETIYEMFMLPGLEGKG